jgi:hypothetical protein
VQRLRNTQSITGAAFATDTLRVAAPFLRLCGHCSMSKACVVNHCPSKETLTVHIPVTPRWAIMEPLTGTIVSVDAEPLSVSPTANATWRVWYAAPPGAKNSISAVCVPCGTLLHCARTEKSRRVANENEVPSKHPLGVLLHTLTIAETSAEEVAGPLETVLPSAQPAIQIAKHAKANKPVRLSSRFVSLNLILSRIVLLQTSSTSKGNAVRIRPLIVGVVRRDVNTIEY